MAATPRPAADRPAEPAEIEQLSTAECWRLVERATLCRLAVERADGGPDIFPMNYVVHDGGVYLRSAPGGKLRTLRSRPEVALEVDGEEDGHHWSVVLRGAAQRLDTDAEIEASGVLRLRSLSPTPKHNFIRVVPRTVSGRRFRIATGRPPTVDAPPAAARASAPVSPSTQPEPRPSAPHTEPHGKPVPIPHTSPIVQVELPDRRRD
ncbi:pyridoxamine 5'-phosphate oxidase family protein [Microbacterium sp.]|uniref:pyridoxamine 5'-phosphate oxidase family protein n=1 Tax=Microbacterium sp. TaxID=51671 RepID=UPI00092B3652|nr:pyridoxamine 5'-phosphate oxidase family protein [Microbacterium sp.]MBN9191613.1 pyridoxamine 5'-phosphate oxidase family protein [Microbacterium sp.]OJU69394.1 MAG: hypothetical protein BGO04_09135 [Microbacterium sp. 70-38]